MGKSYVRRAVEELRAQETLDTAVKNKENQLKELALQEGMVSLKEAGMRKVRAGVTSLEAAFEVTGGE